VSQLNSKFSIIPSVRHIRWFDKAIKLDTPYILLSYAHIGNLKELVRIAKKAGKKVIVNAELVGGLNTDSQGIRFLKQIYGVDIVIVPNALRVNQMKNAGLCTMLRLNLIDSLSLETSLNLYETTGCDAVELRPAYYGIKYVNKFREVRDNIPLYLAGFIEEKEMVNRAKKLGFFGATTSAVDLWTEK